MALSTDSTMVSEWSPFCLETSSSPLMSGLGDSFYINQYDVAELKIELREEGSGSPIPQEQYHASVTTTFHDIVGTRTLHDRRDGVEQKHGSPTQKHILVVGNAVRGPDAMKPLRITMLEIVRRPSFRARKYSLWYSVKHCVLKKEEINKTALICFGVLCVGWMLLS